MGYCYPYLAVLAVLHSVLVVKWYKAPGSVLLLTISKRCINKDELVMKKLDLVLKISNSKLVSTKEITHMCKTFYLKHY